MQYDAKSPEEYLKNLDTDWRKETLKEIRSAILESGPDLQEFIQYKMLGYGQKGKTLFNLNAQKHYVGLYVGNISKIDPDDVLLGHFDKGKGCIRIKKTNASDPALRTFIDKAIQLYREDFDLSC